MIIETEHGVYSLIKNYRECFDLTLFNETYVDVAFDRRLVTQVLKKAKFIKEGSFNETDGIPVIKVTGNIDLAEEVPVPEGNPDETHPYIQRQLAEKLNKIGTAHV